MRAIYFDVSIPRVLTTQALQKVWPGAVYGPTAPTRMGEVEPHLPGPRGIQVENRVCGICASDLHLVFVDVDPAVHPAALPGYDRIYLGHEVVGRIVRCGNGVETRQEGERVLMKSRFSGPTCFSQELTPVCRHCAEGNYALCQNQSARVGPRGLGGGFGDGYTCHETEVWPVPDDITDDQAALIEPLGCSVRAVLRRLPRPGERVLVLGCGIIGLGTLQALRALAPEAEVFALARYPQQQTLARRYGATVIEGDTLESAAELTGAHLYKGPLFNNRTLLGGFDVVYDCVANGATLTQSVRLARAGGTVVMVGVHLRRVKVDLTPVLLQEVDLIGSMSHGAEDFEGERVSTFDLTARLVREGRIDTDDLITHRFPLSDWKKAIRTSVDKRTGAIKVVFDLNGETATPAP